MIDAHLLGRKRFFFAFYSVDLLLFTHKKHLIRWIDYMRTAYFGNSFIFFESQLICAIYFSGLPASHQISVI